MGKISMNTKTPLVGKKEERITIHDVYIIDSSGSMDYPHREGTKAYHAVNGTVENLIASKNDVVTDKLFTVCIFSSSHQIEFVEKVSSNIVSKEVLERRWFGSGTALYDAIGQTINLISETMKSNEKVSIKIFTDGEENNSRLFSSSTIKAMIEAKTAEGWNIAFVGTDADVKSVQKNLSIHKSNTISYDGTGKGFEKSMQATRGAMASYSVKASAGEDVSLGFFKEME